MLLGFKRFLQAFERIPVRQNLKRLVKMRGVKNLQVQHRRRFVSQAFFRTFINASCRSEELLSFVIDFKANMLENLVIVKFWNYIFI